MGKHWKLQDAKNRLSHVVKLAMVDGPQYITVHGKPTAVVISFEEFSSMTGNEQKLSEFLRKSPIRYGELDLERDNGTNRTRTSYSPSAIPSIEMNSSPFDAL